MPLLRSAVLFLSLLIFSIKGLAADSQFNPDIPYQKHILPNGLTVLIHEDHKAPIVAVNVWYHVGSKDERPGRTGFAHLFEHLMFNGSENHDDEFFRPLEAVGASKMNGTTWYDRTNYFENVPTSALDLALWLESDRMGHMLGAITDDKLEQQRNVVLNEKRQGENRPYGKVYDLIAAATYPKGHPYSWTAIGSEDDLNAATLDDVREWFKAHYGASNAVLVIAGDVDTQAVIKKVETYFGDVPPGPPRQRHGPWVAKMTGTKRMALQDRVPQARVFKVWNVPGFCARDTNLLSLSADALGGGKTSRLYQRLVREEQVATSVNVGLGPFEIGSQFMIDALLTPGADPEKVEALIDEELQRFLDQGPTKSELDRVRTGFEAAFIRGLERIDGFGGKSATLARYEVYCGSADWYKREFEWTTQASVREVTEISRQWLSDGQFVLTVEPFPDYAAQTSEVDRSQLPAVGEAPALSLPTLQRTRLSNGIEVFVAERDAAPLVQVSLLFNAGFAADRHHSAGTASMTLDILEEGAGELDSLAFALRKEELAVQIGADSNQDASFVVMDSLTDKLPESLELLSDMVRRPRFDKDELERLRQRRLASIQQEMSQPRGIATRLYPSLLFGQNHPYASPRSGSGTEASIKAMSTDDLRTFHLRWLRPDNLRILVVGDTQLEQVKAQLERAFGDWKVPAAGIPDQSIPKVEPADGPQLFLVNKPGAAQTLVLGASLAPPKADPDDTSMQIVSSVLGGLFVSRLNLNLREDKHWSYGARSALGSAKGQRPFVVYAEIQADKSAQGLAEMNRELREIIGARPITAAELEFATSNYAVGLPGDNETSSDVAGSFLNILQYGLADSYYNDLIPQLKALTVVQVNAAAEKLVRPDSMIWMVVGDLSRIEQSVRDLQLGQVQVLDVLGQPVASDSAGQSSDANEKAPVD